MAENDIISVVLAGAVIIVAVRAYLWVRKQADNAELIRKRRWIEMLPSLVSTCGVLGTFLGITIGLWNFDPANLNDSIPHLLGGLKTAFLTSLAGMAGSMILSRMVSRLYDKEDKGVSDINQAAALIAKSVESMKDDNAQSLQELKNEIKAQSASQNTFYMSMNTFADKIVLAFTAQSSKAQILEENLNSLIVTVGNMGNDVAEVKKLNQTINGSLTSMTNTLSGMTNTLGEIATATEATSSTEDSILEKFDTFGKFIGDEVDDIERKMGETNTLLTNKFDEFSELLKKSNTEALVGRDEAAHYGIPEADERLDTATGAGKLRTAQ